SCIRAVNLRIKRDYAASRRSYEEAWLKSRSAGLEPFELHLLISWSALLLGSVSLPEEYLTMNTRALELALALGFKGEAWSAENNIAGYYLVRNDYSHALSHFLGGWLHIKEARPGSDETLMFLVNIAEVYKALGDYARAQDYLSEALRSLGPNSSPLIRSTLLTGLGEIYLSLARSLPAPEYYDRALECFTSYLKLGGMARENSIDIDVLNDIARIRLAQGRIDEAQAALLPAIERLKTDKTSLFSAETLDNLAAIDMARDRAAEAEECFRQVLAVGEKHENVFLMIRAKCGLGRTSERRGDFGQAVAFYNDAIRLISDKSSLIANDADRAALLSRRREPYQALIDLYYRLAQKGGPGIFEREIYRIAESFRAKSFLEQLERQSRRTEPAAAAPTEKERLENERLELLRRLSRQAARQDRAETEGLQAKIRHIDDLLDAEVFDGSVPKAGTAAPAPAVSLDMLQTSILPERTALVEYFLGDERSFLMCVTRNDFRLFELPAAAVLDNSLPAYLGFLAGPSISAGKGRPAARRLYADLLQPALSLIPDGVDRLIIVPDGVLFRLPFETLALGEAGSSPALYLNDRYVISYAPSAASLYHLKKLPATAYAKEALAFAVPQDLISGPAAEMDRAMSAAAVLDDLYHRSGFTLGPIPYSRAEVEGLKKRFGPDKTDVFVGDKATEAAFKHLDLGPYRLIHLACHAILDDRYPLRSALALAPGGEGDEDGFLQVSEMYRMRTRADLVVLSACQTGRGKIVR
ncbi:MAG: CHAT domain-containing tetratricopeptide repeat protein, partial [Acidobacteriota bacterium]